MAYLYVASTPQAALAEARPALKQLVTLGVFRPVRDLQVVVCDQWADDADFFLPLTDAPAQRSPEEEPWKDIAEAFSTPINRDDPVCYIPTQIIAELFRVEGADGVAYRSRLGEGTNVTLFDLTLAPPTKPFRCFLYSATKISLEFTVEGINGIYAQGEKKVTMVSKLETSGC